jgi:hypothetical protein
MVEGMLPTEKSIAETEQNNVDGADGTSDADFRPELTDTSKNLETNLHQQSFRHTRGSASPSRLLLRG